MIVLDHLSPEDRQREALELCYTQLEDPTHHGKPFVPWVLCGAAANILIRKDEAERRAAEQRSAGIDYAVRWEPTLVQVEEYRRARGPLFRPPQPTPPPAAS